MLNILASELPIVGHFMSIDMSLGVEGESGKSLVRIWQEFGENLMKMSRESDENQMI